MAMLILGLFESNNAMEECDDKQDIIYPGSTKSLKIILILLIKVIAVYVKFFQIRFRGPNLKKALSRLCLLLNLY